jgi:hypothetical protein
MLQEKEQVFLIFVCFERHKILVNLKLFSVDQNGLCVLSTKNYFLQPSHILGIGNCEKAGIHVQAL